MEKSVLLFNLLNLENVLQRNLRTGMTRECIFRASGGTRFKNKGGGGTGLPKKTLDTSLYIIRFCWKLFFRSARFCTRISLGKSASNTTPISCIFQIFQWVLKHTSIYVISGCLKCDQTAVHCFLSKAITLMKQKVNNIKIIHYYSDGAWSQYKNYKGLVNLCDHRLD